MGNGLACMPGEEELRRGLVAGSKRIPSASRSQKRTAAETEEELLHRQALAMAIQQKQQQLSQRFEGSMSRRIGSTSSRRRDPSDTDANGKQLPVVLQNLETKKIVLVHGEGFGAWCWYKTMPLLEEVGLHPVVLNLAGSGTDHTDTNSIATLSDYAKPLIDYLHNLQEGDKVILVSHSCGGAIASYAIERYPKKISKAVFISASMVLDGEMPLDVFSDQLPSADIFMQKSQFLVYGNGNDKPPTSLVFDKEKMKSLYFNQSASKDIALATMSMRPIPLAPFMEKLSLTSENYGTVRRFFVQTLDDHFLSLDMQEKLVSENPPHGVYRIKGSDHCPFFSKPLSLHKILVDIAQI